MIFRRFLGILTDCLRSEANEDDINALSGLCVSTPPGPPFARVGKSRLRAQQKCSVGNGFYLPKEAALSSAQAETGRVGSCPETPKSARKRHGARSLILAVR
jgi:hypothetical protein